MSDYIFQAEKHDKDLSNAVMDKLLQVTMEYEVTVHGFRSTFRDWAGEKTNYPNALCEVALAHTKTILGFSDTRSRSESVTCFVIFVFFFF